MHEFEFIDLNSLRDSSDGEESEPKEKVKVRKSTRNDKSKSDDTTNVTPEVSNNEVPPEESPKRIRKLTKKFLDYMGTELKTEKKLKEKPIGNKIKKTPKKSKNVSSDGIKKPIAKTLIQKQIDLWNKRHKSNDSQDTNKLQTTKSKETSRVTRGKILISKSTIQKPMQPTIKSSELQDKSPKNTKGKKIIKLKEIGKEYGDDSKGNNGECTGNITLVKIETDEGLQVIGGIETIVEKVVSEDEFEEDVLEQFDNSIGKVSQDNSVIKTELDVDFGIETTVNVVKNMAIEEVQEIRESKRTKRKLGESVSQSIENEKTVNAIGKTKKLRLRKGITTELNTDKTNASNKKTEKSKKPNIVSPKIVTENVANKMKQSKTIKKQYKKTKAESTNITAAEESNITKKTKYKKSDVESVQTSSNSRENMEPKKKTRSKKLNKELTGISKVKEAQIESTEPNEKSTNESNTESTGISKVKEAQIESTEPNEKSTNESNTESTGIPKEKGSSSKSTEPNEKSINESNTESTGISEEKETQTDSTEPSEKLKLEENNKKSTNKSEIKPNKPKSKSKKNPNAIPLYPPGAVRPNRFVLRELMELFCPRCGTRHKYNYGEKLKNCPKCSAHLHTICLKCQHTYSCYNNMTMHIKYGCNKVNRFFCNDCSYGTYRKYHLLQHIRTTHLKISERFKCNECGLVLSTDKNLRNHKADDCIKKVFRDKYMCHKCHFQTWYSNCLKKHIKNVHDRDENTKYPCKNCGREYKSYNGMMTHFRFKCGKERKICCAHCDYKTHCKSPSIIIHIQRNHRELFPKNAFTCKYCKKSYSNEFALRRHIKHTYACMKKYKEREEKKIAKRALKKELMAQKLLNESQVIQKQNDNKEEYEVIKTVEHVTIEGQDGSENVNEARNDSKKRNELSTEVITQKENQTIEEQNRSKTVEGGIEEGEESVTQNDSKKPNELSTEVITQEKNQTIEEQNHNKTTDEGLRKEEKPSKKSNSKDSGKEEKPSKESNSKDLGSTQNKNKNRTIKTANVQNNNQKQNQQSTIMTRRTRSANYKPSGSNGVKIADHVNANGTRETVIKRKDSIVERFTCPTELILVHCPNCNTTIEKPPRKRMTTCQRCDSSLLLQCSKCRKLFRKYMTLYCHVKAICGNPKKLQSNTIDLSITDNRVTCEDCGTKFSNFENLKRHKRLTCKRQAAYKCSSCPFSSKYKASLELHEKNQHKDLADEDLYKCTWCRKKFRHSQTLKRHETYNCGKEKSFSCGHCDYKCYLKYQLKYHMQSKHEILFTNGTQKK